MSTAPVTDQLLWDAITRDDRKAFTLLYERYWRKLHATAHYYLHDRALADQVVQDTFVVLWQRRHHLQIEHFPAYLQTTARYHVFKLSKATTLAPVSFDRLDEELLPVSHNAAEEKMDEEALQVTLAGQLNGLPKRCREIFWLSRIEHLTNDEIAEQLHISKRAVENQIYLAQKHLRTVLGEATVTAMAFWITTLF